ncbi:conserved hypothetical protein [Culex quinquefasciatus]|uniref:Uncharacterized protein n=1 Tax=Culex quinquefasciatus TaxID=7176 RepID=B0X4R4_CULQU|nr:conserved hypothetical protein [Culex quinquefasciatus]|eukprot:XP_001864636.1 conserved hypothetical protein [Culex quinquefasciatus]
MAEIHRNNYFDMQRKEGQRSPTGPVLIKGKPSNTNITRMQEIYPEPTGLQPEKEASVQLHQSKQSQEPKSGKDPSLFDFAAQAQYVKQCRIVSGAPKPLPLVFRSKHDATTVQLRQNRNEETFQRPSSSTARKKSYQTSPIWCLDFLDNLIVIGCADGRLEFWDGTTGNLKTQGRQIDWGFTSAYRRTHICTGSAGSLSMFQQPNGPTSVHHASEEELRCILKFHQQGPQMPETCREVAGETVMTCSMDHTVKVFRHCYCGPISCHGPFEPPKPGAGCDLGRGQPQDARVRFGISQNGAIEDSKQNPRLSSAASHGNRLPTRNKTSIDGPLSRPHGHVVLSVEVFVFDLEPLDHYRRSSASNLSGDRLATCSRNYSSTHESVAYPPTHLGGQHRLQPAQAPVVPETVAVASNSGGESCLS